MKKQKITKAVFPVAGLGTRFLPATKASSKAVVGWAGFICPRGCEISVGR